MAKKLKMVNTTNYKEPETFEEWVAIHGEPEYVAKPKDNMHNLAIEVLDCEPPYPIEQTIDMDGVFYKDDKDKLQVNYLKFAEVFKEINQLAYCNGTYYTPRGAVTKESVERDVQGSLEDAGWTAKVDTTVRSLMDTIRIKSSVDELKADERVIPLANGDLHITTNGEPWVFRDGELKHCPYRLTVAYTPLNRTMPLFNKWLNDVFMPEDIPTVQELFGYCLVPVTTAQEAFILVGDAGVGKSGLGAIMNGMFGNGFVTMETQNLVTEKFEVAMVENKLVAYDDDLGSAALTETGLLKKLISADAPIKAEKKYADPHMFNSYCRIVASANFMLSSLYDDSDGFYRRLHPIHVKPKDENRENIRGFYEMILAQEKMQILKWALVGLNRVIKNGWKITWSDRSMKYLASAKSSNVHFEDFFKDVFEVSEEGDVATAEIKSTYKSWCKENGINPASDRRLGKWFADKAEKLSIRADKNLKRGTKYVRGYRNISVKPEWNPNRISLI